jgi:hypothetical protein
MENGVKCEKCNNTANRLIKAMCESCYKKEFYTLNKEKFKLKNKQYYTKNREQVLAEKKEYNRENKHEIRRRRSRYYSQNRSKIVKQNLAYIIERSKTDIMYRISRNIRARLNKALVNNYKNSSAVRDLGCSIQELRSHLESKFTPGMSWNNYGIKGWHIDHVVPISNFDLSDPEQAKLACHYTNLQPLWWTDNLRKGSRDAV